MNSSNPGVESGSSSMGHIRGNKTDKSRRVWLTREEEMLIALLKELVAQGWKGDNGFMTGYLQKLEDGMKKEFPRTDLKALPHINSKITAWKKNYASLCTMLGGTGVGFSQKEDHMIECTNEKWDQVVKNDPNARLMRHKPFPFFDEWIYIFGKDKATGECAKDVMDAVNEILKKDDIAQARDCTRPNVNLDPGCFTYNDDVRNLVGIQITLVKK